MLRLSSPGFLALNWCSCPGGCTQRYYAPGILIPGFQLSDSGTYFIPDVTSIGAVRSYLSTWWRGRFLWDVDLLSRIVADTLPAEEDPEVFGLHSNGKISLRISEASYMVSSLLAMQPRTTTTGSGDTAISADDQVLSAIEGILKTVPASLRRGDAGYSTFVTVASSGATHSLGTVLLQEMDKYNVLLDTVVSTTHELRSAVKGLVVMSMELDVMYTSVLNNKVRLLWALVIVRRCNPPCFLQIRSLKRGPVLGIPP